MISDPDGATALDPDEAEDLIPAHIATREDLNAWETANILEADRWAFSRGHTDFLSIEFLKRLHRKMFDNTWSWAGRLRQSDKNIGIPWEQVPPALRNLLDDVAYWMEHGTFDMDESAARFHHRLTQIHPFHNGNGRHARLMTDLLLVSNGRPRFVWGRGDLDRSGDVRGRYITALRRADGGDYGALFDFLRRP